MEYQKFYSEIRNPSAIDSNQQEFVMSAENAKSMWDNLQSVYMKSDPKSKSVALNNFHRYKYEDIPMASHIAKIENLAKAGAIVGEPHSEANVVAKILDGLPERFNGVITAW